MLQSNRTGNTPLVRQDCDEYDTQTRMILSVTTMISAPTRHWICIYPPTQENDEHEVDLTEKKRKTIVRVVAGLVKR